MSNIRFHIGMNLHQVSELVDDMDMLRDAWHTIESVLTMPPITQGQIEELEIPDGAMYVQFKGALNGVPTIGRVIKTREGVDISLDVRYDTQRLRMIQGHIERRIGRMTLTVE